MLERGGAGEVRHPVGDDALRARGRVEAERVDLVARAFAREANDVVDRVRHSRGREVLERLRDARAVAFAIERGERIGVHALHAHAHHHAAGLGQVLGHLARHRLRVRVALERQPDLAAVAVGELRHPACVEREDRVPEKNLAHPPAPLPERQLVEEMPHRAAAHRALARILPREGRVLAEAAAERTAAPRDHVVLALERRHLVVEQRLVGVRQRIEIGDERAQRVLALFEPHVGHVGAAEAALLGAREQVDERALAFAFHDRVDRRLADRVRRRARHVRPAEHDRHRPQPLERARDLHRPAVRDRVRAERDHVGPRGGDARSGRVGARLDQAREQPIVGAAVRRERLGLVDQRRLVTVRARERGQRFDAEVLEPGRHEGDAHRSLSMTRTRDARQRDQWIKSEA